MQVNPFEEDYIFNPLLEDEENLLYNEYNTYDDWRILGFQVKKGEKSKVKNNDEVALFSGKQVYHVSGLLNKLNNDVIKYKNMLNTIKNNKIVNILINLKILDMKMFNYE